MCADMMTSRQRLKTVLDGLVPDCVPVAPDISNMIPCRLTGKPFWDIYLYNDPPLWMAYIDAVKFFGLDSLMDGYVNVFFDGLDADDSDWIETIIFQDDDRIITQKYRKRQSGHDWNEYVTLYPKDNPPWIVRPELLHLSAVPSSYVPVEGKKIWDRGPATLKVAKERLGDSGLIGVTCGTSMLLHDEESIMKYFDDPGYFHEKRDKLLDYYEQRFNRIINLPDDTRPDFIATGGSGTFVFQTEAIFRDLALPIVQKMTRLAKENGLYSHIHSCGPESKLVEICYSETDLTVIDPLEIPHMGDCNLRSLKQLYGHKLVLKGNIHTINVMLNGTVADVVSASEEAIDDAAFGGRFILSTGDQCGRDTPFENIQAMVNTARTYGKYTR